MRFPSFLLALPLLAQQPAAHLHGTVLDPAGAVIANASVQVVSDAVRCDTKSDSRGEFHCRLVPGSYRIASDIEAYFAYNRAIITLAPGHSFVKVRPVLSADPINDDTIYPQGFRPVARPRDPGPNIQEHRVNGTEVFIRYGTSSKADGIVYFRGPSLMLTSNLLAVYADTIACTEALQSCAAQGSVRIETGSGEEIEGSRVDINLVNHELKLTREPVVVRQF